MSAENLQIAYVQMYILFLSSELYCILFQVLYVFCLTWEIFKFLAFFQTMFLFPQHDCTLGTPTIQHWTMNTSENSKEAFALLLGKYTWYMHLFYNNKHIATNYIYM